jgi:DNA invertase Pin-like site-specific DNA recombinase
MRPIQITKKAPKLTRGAKLIGYARVSTKMQDLTRQLNALKAERCDVIFSDVASGKSRAGRTEFQKLLKKLAPNDTLVIAEWDRATRSMWDGLAIVKEVIDAGANIRVLDFPSLDLATPEGRGFLAMFSAIAERERLRLIKRTTEGRAIAKQRGVKFGRKPRFSREQAERISKRLANGESTREIAADFDVSPTTINRLR